MPRQKNNYKSNLKTAVNEYNNPNNELTISEICKKHNITRGQFIYRFYVTEQLEIPKQKTANISNSEIRRTVLEPPKQKTVLEPTPSRRTQNKSYALIGAVPINESNEIPKQSGGNRRVSFLKEINEAKDILSNQKIII